MAHGEVFVIDRVVTRPGCARQFVDTYLAEYAPGARERGMTLRDVLVSPPIWFDDQSNVVTVSWVLPNPRAWWEMTWKGRPDKTIGQWWDNIGELVVERSRSVAAAAGDVDGLCDVQAISRGVPLVTTTTSPTRRGGAESASRGMLPGERK